jgi:hypothetical protein
MTIALSPARRVLRRIFAKIVVTESGCWHWTGCVNTGGYSHIDVPSRAVPGRWTRTTTGHRWLWQWLYGRLDSTVHLDHLCRNRRCVNPAHLEPVTPRVNVMRSDGPCAINARKTHCKQGHAFAEHGKIDCRGKRVCCICDNERLRISNKAKRAAKRAGTWIGGRRSHAGR